MKVVVIGHGDMLANLIAGCMDAKADIVGVLRYDRVQKSWIKRVLSDIFNPALEYNYIKSYGLKEINAKSANSESFRRKLLKLNVDILPKDSRCIIGHSNGKILVSTFDVKKYDNNYFQYLKNISLK